jgi:hypothetical protein
MVSERTNGGLTNQLDAGDGDSTATSQNIPYSLTLHQTVYEGLIGRI